MAMTPERSNPLHNFNLPSRLTWGAQRHLRCKKIEEDDAAAPQPDRSDRARRSDGGSQIEAIGEKLMLDFKLRMDNLKVVGTAEDDKKKAAAAEAGIEAESSRPWNLRTRRSPAPVPPVGGVAVERRRPVVGERSSPVKRLRGVSEEKEEKVKFRVPLKREEVEEDFMLMAGIKPPRRPKKRPRAIQKELDTLFPGLWLTEVTPERYVVPEAPES
uniref:DUF1639 family protein n=1 Tax=Kalanchoe fedtschenkoi TaxID=63787 RepID=A0A7N0T175_KALFE